MDRYREREREGERHLTDAERERQRERRVEGHSIQILYVAPSPGLRRSSFDLARRREITELQNTTEAEVKEEEEVFFFLSW